MLLSRLAACVLLLCAAASPVLAQAGLPDPLVERARLTDDDLRLIQQYVERYKAALGNTKDPNAVRVARNNLIEPLTNPEASVDFRIRYSEILVPLLDPLSQDKDDFIASNAVRILGELATPRAIERITSAMTDKRPAVRFSAAYAAQRTFENVKPPRSPGLTSEQAKGLIDLIAARVSAEDDANVAQELVSAFEAAAEIPSSQLKDVRAHAVANAARSVAARAKAMDGKTEIASGWRMVIWRANRLARTALTQAPAGEPRLSPEALKQVGGLAGHSLALALRRHAAGVASAPERELLVQIVALAEASYYFAHSARGGGQNIVDKRLGQTLQAGDDARFRTDVLEVVGPNGALTGPDFGFPDNEFVAR